MNEWKPLNGRITFFLAMPGPSPLPSPFDLYKKIWSDDPDFFQKQANVLMPMVAQGKRGSLMVNCVVHPVRIDFNLTAASSQEAQMTVALVDHPIELRDELKRIIDLLDEGLVSNSISRVALQLQFLNLKPSHAEANKAVTEIIPDPYGVTITDEEDFVFQINRPRMDEDFRDIRMNFLTKWSVEQFQVLTIPIAIGGVPVAAGMVSPSLQAKTFISASVVFDNNNTPTPNRTLTGKEQSALLHKAFDAAVEMQKKIGLNVEGF
jgi:hypothetical protein